jgi:hypothetical protein
MTQPVYIRHFPSENEADAAMRTKNQTNCEPSWMWVLVEGPDDGQWSVMDLRGAIEGRFDYRWAAR